MGNKLLLIGGGGHCRSVLDSLLELQLYEKIGIIDQPGPPILGISVIGQDEDLPRLKEDGWTDAFITVGSIGDTSLRHKLFQMVKKMGFTIPSVIDPSAVIGGEVDFAEGCFVGKKAIVNAGSAIGVCAIINSGAIVEHDCIVGDFAHISPGAILCGGVNVGNDTHVGAGTSVKQCITIGRNTIIGIGSTIIYDIPDGVTVYGKPGKETLS